MFGTNPTDQTDAPKKRKNKKVFNFREQVYKSLRELGVPHVVADVAIIDDFGGNIKLCMHENIAPHATAELMMETLERRYKNEDGSWHYSKKDANSCVPF